MAIAHQVLEELRDSAPPVVRLVIVDGAPVRQLQIRHRRERSTSASIVVVVAPDDDWVRVVGPTADVETRVAPDALRRLLGDLDGMGPLDAARHLARELPLLTEAESIGLTVNGLGTKHVFADRLRDSARWQSLIETVELVDRGDWRSLLRSLGYEVEQLPREGYLARLDGAPVAVVVVRASAADFTRLDAEGRLPSGLLLSLCRAEGASYGILVAGTRFRLYSMSEASAAAASRFIELDSSLLVGDDAPLLGLLGADSLGRGGLAQLVEEAEAYGQSLRERLDQVLRQSVLPNLGVALGRWAHHEGRDLGDSTVLEELEGAALSFVFRVVFLLHAEAAGFLPMDNASYRARSMTKLCERAQAESSAANPASTSCWDDLRNLVNRVRSGHAPWGLPAYNGDLFASDGIAGAEVLEVAAIGDELLAPVLAALGRDPDQPGIGLDYSGLGVEHLGYVYEGLLSLRLTPAERPYVYDQDNDQYVEASASDAEIAVGELLWLTNEGGRKRQAVYYTPTVIVLHLIRTGVRPAFARHLDRVRSLAETDPRSAASELFNFATLDPACGSAHFLVEVVNELADQVARFIGEVPLPGVREQLDQLRASAGTYGALVDDTALVRRLVLKRCVFGVDLSPLGAEIAKVSLWLSTFVPGLALSYLDHNVRRGNSLVGIADLIEIGTGDLLSAHLHERIAAAGKAAAELGRIDDATPEDYRRSRDAAAQVEQDLTGATRVLDLYTAGLLGLPGAAAEAQVSGIAIIDGIETTLMHEAQKVSKREHRLHWPLAFPEIFSRDRPGFDAVIGNPPWDEVTVEELAFYTRYRPRLRSLDEAAQRAEIQALVEQRPELPALLEAERALLAEQRAYFSANPAFGSTSGDPDVAKLFARRYATLLREDGTLAVVLPRTLTSSKGGSDFRAWLLTECFPERIDFLLNRKQWAFPIHPQYTIALISARKGGVRSDDEPFEVAGIASSRREFDLQVGTPGISMRTAALGRLREIPLLKSQAEADLLAQLRRGGSVVFGDGRWKCFPVAELHETNDKHLWRGETAGVPLWKGESFDQYDPHGSEARPCPLTEEVLKLVGFPPPGKTSRMLPGKESIVGTLVPIDVRRAAVQRAWGRARLAFRDVARATDSRTARAAMVPPGVLLTNKAPYLAFVDDDPVAEAACLGVLNSLTFDWQARRFVETNINFFVLEGLKAPRFDDRRYEAIAERAARLSSVDDQFAEFAAANGVDVNMVATGDRERVRAEVDALVALTYDLTDKQMELVFSGFTEAAVPLPYRDLVRKAMSEFR